MFLDVKGSAVNEGKFNLATLNNYDCKNELEQKYGYEESSFTYLFKH